MSYIDDLNDVAARAQSSADIAEAATQILYDVANGTDTSTVSTDAGFVKTVAKAIKDITDNLVGGILSAETEEVVLSEGQTTVTLSSLRTYVRPLLFIEGAFETDFEVTSDTTLELPQSFPDGTRIWVVQSVVASDLEASFVKSLNASMTVDSVVLGATTLGSASDATIKINIGGTDYYLPAYTTAP